MLSALIACVGLASASPDLYQYGNPGVQTTGVGAGVLLGSPAGLSLVWRPHGWNAVQGSLGWDWRRARLDTSVDYLRTLAVVQMEAPMHVSIFAGVGGQVATTLPGIDGGSFLGKVFGQNRGPILEVRVPVGASWFFERTPIELFTQVVPKLQVVPGLWPGLDLGVGARYYF